jgi:hypothetical protein
MPCDLLAAVVLATSFFSGIFETGTSSPSAVARRSGVPVLAGIRGSLPRSQIRPARRPGALDRDTPGVVRCEIGTKHFLGLVGEFHGSAAWHPAQVVDLLGDGDRMRELFAAWTRAPWQLTDSALQLGRTT